LKSYHSEINGDFCPNGFAPRQIKVAEFIGARAFLLFPIAKKIEFFCDLTCFEITNNPEEIEDLRGLVYVQGC
jgi:hypothetical protein